MRDRIAAFSFGSHSIDVASELSEDPHHDSSSWPACNYAKPRWRSCSTGDAATSILITLSPSRSPISSIESANAYRFQWVLLLDVVFTALDDSTGFRTAPPQGFHGHPWAESWVRDLNGALSNAIQSEDQRWLRWPLLNFNSRGLVDRSDGAKQSVHN